MGVKSGAATRYYHRNTGLPTFASHTISMWVRVGTNRGAAVFETTHSGGLLITGIDASGGINLWNGSQGFFGSGITTGVWLNLTTVVDNTAANGVTIFRNGVADVTGSTGTSGTTNKLWLGTDQAPANDWLNGDIACCKIWDAALTANEVKLEIWQFLPVRQANLNAFYPFFSTSNDTIDYSVNARTLTKVGTLTDTEGPPIPWRRARSRFVFPAGAAAAPVTTDYLFSLPQPQRPKKHVVAY